MTDQIKLTAWEATGKFTNEVENKIVEEFGAQIIDNELLDRFIKITGKEPHRMLRRGLFFAHRDLEKILDDYEKGEQIFIYTGRGPSTESLHLGHYTVIEFTKWLQDIFNAITIIQIADDEKYWFKDLKFNDVYRLGFENAKDIIAFGFKPEKTFIFSNRDFARDPHYQTVFSDISKNIKISQIKATFGIEDNYNVGQMIWPIYQMTASFSKSFNKIFGNKKVRCLIPHALDQDVYFRLSRDVARKLKSHKPSSIMSRFLPSSIGDSKMSSTSARNQINQTVFLTDTRNQVKKKVNKYNFSGGKETLEEHRKYGGDPDVDISYQWLKYFLEDDELLDKLEKDYRSGKLLSGELKKITIDTVYELINTHQESRIKLTDDYVNEFYSDENII